MVDASSEQVLNFEFDSIEDALIDLAAGRAIVVVDDENRENEGDVICAAQFATPDLINFMAGDHRHLRRRPGANDSGCYQSQSQP